MFPSRSATSSAVAMARKEAASRGGGGTGHDEPTSRPQATRGRSVRDVPAEFEWLGSKFRAQIFLLRVSFRTHAGDGDDNEHPNETRRQVPFKLNSSCPSSIFSLLFSLNSSPIQDLLLSFSSHTLMPRDTGILAVVSFTCEVKNQLFTLGQRLIAQCSHAL